MFNLVTSRSQRAFPPSKKSISFSHRMERVLQTTPGQKKKKERQLRNRSIYIACVGGGKGFGLASKKFT